MAKQSALFRRLGRKAPQARQIPPLAEPRSERMLYSQALRSHVREWTRKTLEILDRYFDSVVGVDVGVTAQLQQRGTFTVHGDGVNSKLQTAIDLITVTWEDIENKKQYGKLLNRIGDSQNKRAGNYIKHVVGLNPRAEARTGTAIDTFRDRNLSLIKSLEHDSIAKLRTILERAEKGTRVEDIREQIQHLGDVSESRADLIARDQTGKLNGQLNQLHQTNAGIEEYDWSTSGDERVRSGHEELDGTRQRWDSPPDTGNGEHYHPGDDIQCRCSAIPVIPEFEAFE